METQTPWNGSAAFVGCGRTQGDGCKVRPEAEAVYQRLRRIDQAQPRHVAVVAHARGHVARNHVNQRNPECRIRRRFVGHEDKPVRIARQCRQRNRCAVADGFGVSGQRRNDSTRVERHEVGAAVCQRSPDSDVTVHPDFGKRREKIVSGIVLLGKGKFVKRADYGYRQHLVGSRIVEKYPA